MTDIPPGLGPEGVALWQSIADFWELTPAELRFLLDACTEADLIADMTADWQAAGAPMTAKGSMGQTVAHPYLGEVRQHRSTLRQLIVAMKLPHPEDEPAAEPLTRSEVSRLGAYAKHGHKGSRVG